MDTQFRRALIPEEISGLVRFDRKAFRDFPADWFEADDWRAFECWWMIVRGRKVGCCAFDRHVDFKQDLREDGRNPKRRGSLYIASTGLLPDFRGQSLGTLLKSWQIAYARRHKFTRVITNTRKSNKAMVELNKKFGFKVVRTTPDYYFEPSEATVVMQLVLTRRK